MSLYSHLNQQLHKRNNNKGSSLVTVLLVSSIVAILVTVVLAIVLLNVYMKKADKEGQETFYDAESAFEEVRAGLAQEVSDATTTAYIDTLSNYANLKDEKKTENFNRLFEETLKNKLTVDANTYNIDTLEGYLKETKYNDEEGYGAKITTSTEDARFNVTKEGAVLKNVTIRYVDKSDYVSEIKADIVLEYPPIDFKNASSIDNVLAYGIIANNKFLATKGSTTKINGNAYLGTNGADITGTTVEFGTTGTQESNVISGGNIKLTKNSTVNSKGISLWADSIVNEDSTFNMVSGSSFIKNDLVLGNGGQAKLAGKLIMFGNPWVAISEQMVESKEVRDAATADMPSYSSSILIKGANAGIDLSGLNTMVIGGSAYVDGKGSDVVTGQSMMLKSDQRAYLVPTTLVGANNKPVKDTNGNVVGYTNYDAGLTNPMTGTQYERLLEEVRVAKGYSSVSEVKSEDIVNFDMAEPTIGISLNAFQGYDPTKEVGENNPKPSYKLCAYPTKAGSMVYLFIDFKTRGNNYSGAQNSDYIPAEAYYNMWYKYYNSTMTNGARLASNLDYYTTYGIKLPSNVNDKTKMYFTGNILATDPNKVIVSDIITQPDFTMDLNVEYSTQSAYYQDAYYTLNKNLSTRYSSLDTKAKANDLFKNIINTSPKVGDTTYNLSGTNYYVSTSGEGTVVVGGDFTYSNTNENNLHNTKDANGNTHSDAKINFIIATGDVTVSKDFEGVIIAGGNISVDAGVNISAESEKAAKAFVAAKYNDVNDCAANYVINAAKYLLGGTGKADGDTGVISMKDFVTYRNWTKQ